MAHFDGFRTADFDTLDGSSWRGRDALGGVLSRALRGHCGSDCQSWGVRRRVELHLAKRSQYSFDDPVPVAKLFVYSYDELAYGFYVESTGKRDDDSEYVHWKNFRDRLQVKSPLRDALKAAVDKHTLLFTDYYRHGDSNAPIGRFSASKGAVQFLPRGSNKWQNSTFSAFTSALAKLSGDDWVNVHIYARMTQQAAIKLGPRVVVPILSVLDSLAPVYMATIAQSITKAK